MQGMNPSSNIIIFYIRKSLFKILTVTVTVAVISGCAAVHNTQLAYRCHENITSVSLELDNAKKDGFDHSSAWTRAAALLNAAKINQQIEEFPNCINKSARARYYISRSQELSSL